MSIRVRFLACASPVLIWCRKCHRCGSDPNNPDNLDNPSRRSALARCLGHLLSGRPATDFGSRCLDSTLHMAEALEGGSGRALALASTRPRIIEPASRAAKITPLWHHELPRPGAIPTAVFKDRLLDICCSSLFNTGPPSHLSHRILSFQSFQSFSQHVESTRDFLVLDRVKRRALLPLTSGRSEQTPSTTRHAPETDRATRASTQTAAAERRDFV